MIHTDDIPEFRKATQTILDAIWNRGHTPKLLIDARHHDVIIPEHTRKKFGERLPIDLVASYPLNLSYDNDAFRVDLAFAGSTVRCAFPWTRIYAIIDRETGEAAVVAENQPDKNPPPPIPGEQLSEEEARRRRPELYRLLDRAKSSAPVADTEPPPTADPVPRRGLTVIKGGKA